METLPLTNDVSPDPPPTVDGASPSSWYRLAPDLDIAWYQDGESEPMFCWRTPTIQDCAPDSAPTTARFVSTAGGQELVIVSGDRTQAILSIALDDGSVLTAPIAWDGQIDWGVARFELPVGRDPSSLRLVGASPPPRAIATDETVTGDIATVDTRQFLPVVTYADGSAVSPTVPAGSPLTFYQWLPDLAFAERQTADGAGTEFCWRTTAGIGCILEEFESPAVGIIPTAGGAIFLVRPALVTIEPAPTDPSAPTLEVGPNPTIVTVTLSDGSTSLVDVEYEQDFGVGHAQITLPAGVTVTGAASS